MHYIVCSPWIATKTQKEINMTIIRVPFFPLSSHPNQSGLLKKKKTKNGLVYKKYYFKIFGYQLEEFKSKACSL